MNAPRIVIVDIAGSACPAERCGRIETLLRRASPAPELDILRVTQVPLVNLSPAPDLLFLRPSSGHSLPQLVSHLRQRDSSAAFVGLCCATQETPATVWQSLCNGLDDFLCCPFTELDLLPRVLRLLPQWHARPIAHEDEIPLGVSIDGVLGESPAFLRVLAQLPKIANTDATVLLTGETGTGKEVIARTLHYQSPRHGQPFIPVNCGALPDHLLENELFGHSKGAFTDASSAAKGLLAEAEGGTLFLDEVDALSAAAQVKLLRVLQTREYRPLGSTKSTLANVRIIAATNADLRTQVHAGLFRADLYYRLHLLSVQLPPLRERCPDIPLLARHFLQQYGQLHGRAALRLTPSAIRKLMTYPWPGNVRELEGVIQRSVILLSTSVVDAEDLDLPTAAVQIVSGARHLRAAKSQVIEQFEQSYLTDLLTAHSGNVTQAAKQAGKDRRTLQRLLRRHGLDRRVYSQ